MTSATIPAPDDVNAAAQDRRDIKRGANLNIVGFVCRLGARIPFLLIAGRLYGTETYGVYVLATAVVETAAMVSSYGLKRTLFQFIDADSRDPVTVVRHALLVSLGLSMLLVVALLMSARGLATLFSMQEAEEAISLLVWTIPFISLTDVLLSATLSRRIMWVEIAVRSFVEPVALTLFSLALFYAGLHEMGLIAAFVGAFTLACGVSAGQCGRLFGGSVFLGPFDVALIVRILRRSCSTCLHDLSRVLIIRLDTFMVGYFFSSSAVGLYGMAQQFLTIIEKIALSFYPMLMPVVMSAVKAGDHPRLIKQLKTAGGRMVVLQAPVVMVFFFFGRDLLALVGRDFAAAWPVLMILTIGCWLNAALQTLEIPLTYLNPRANLIACLAALAAYFAIIIPMQGVWGMTGVALTSALSLCCASVVLAIQFIALRVRPFF